MRGRKGKKKIIIHGVYEHVQGGKKEEETQKQRDDKWKKKGK